MADLTERAPEGDTLIPDAAEVQRIQGLPAPERPHAIGYLGRTMVGVGEDTRIEELQHPERTGLLHAMRVVNRAVYPDLTE